MAGERKQRRDAVANHARIAEAAARVFREEGLSADMRRVAEASGVGIGTVYRHFPTRDALVHAAVGTDMAELADANLRSGGTAAEAVREFFTIAVAEITSNRAMADVLTRGPANDEDMQRCLTHLTRVGQEAVDRSGIDHSLSDQVTATDIAYQLLGLIRIAQLLHEGDTGTITRHVDIALRGLSAPAAPDSHDRPPSTVQD